MVAPTRAPQVRGAKCDLCKKILALSTWLDQTKLAKTIEDAKIVLDLLKQHEGLECPCIPRSIQNLLEGSTHFEIHRLAAKNLDLSVHKLQKELSQTAVREASHAAKSQQHEEINDCRRSIKGSRFNIYAGHSDQKHIERAKQQLTHLFKAIDFWKAAMDDLADPFNCKLALRLGLTHHVIYACYLFKFNKILDYQLVSASLLLKIFRAIESVTVCAILHANFLLIKSLMDCDELQLARLHLQEAIKIPIYLDKSHYECILLTCVACELDLLTGASDYTLLDELQQLAIIKPDDKLQHYYARTLAISILAKYVHRYKSGSEYCFEFYHCFRYTCAIIRRCFENAFGIVISERETTKQVNETQQILDHNWIKFAICDFVYPTFDFMTQFFIRAGLPENLELPYNALNLIAYRTGSNYWQARMCSLGLDLDILCDKFDSAEFKLNVMSRVAGYPSHKYLMNISRLDLEVSHLKLTHTRGEHVDENLVSELVQRIAECRSSILARLAELNLSEYKLKSTLKMYESDNSNQALMKGDLGHMSLKAFKVVVASLIRRRRFDEAKKMVCDLGSRVKDDSINHLTFNDVHLILETMLEANDIHNTEQILLNSVRQSSIFMKSTEDATSIESQFSTLTLESHEPDDSILCEEKRSMRSRHKSAKRKPTKSRSRRKGSYILVEDGPREGLDLYHAMRNLVTMTDEEIALCYLKHSEPNPDYLLYKYAHELLLSHRIREEPANQNLILYHFCESSSANSMRYRCMMYEEQQVSPFDPQKSTNKSRQLKYMAFNSPTDRVVTEKTIKQLTRYIADDYRIVQLKFILDRGNKTEHLLGASVNSTGECLFVLMSKMVSSENFLRDANDNIDNMTLPRRFDSLIDDAKKTLFYKNQRARSEARKRIEGELGLILDSIESDWLGEFRFKLFQCRGQLGLILDGQLENLAFESMPIVKVSKQSIFRVPSLRVFAALINRSKANLQANLDESTYVLDPANNLNKTRDRFESKLRSQPNWIGVMGQPPETNLLEQWLTNKDVYLFIGHGAGTIYYNKLCKGRGLSAMSSVNPVAIVMGCSSGRVVAEGPKLESYGIGWVFVMRGSPCYVGLLWDVTDTDIDKFLGCLLSNWTGRSDLRVEEAGDWQNYPIVSSADVQITDAVVKARNVCQYQYLVGASPVVYGLPTTCCSGKEKGRLNER